MDWQSLIALAIVAVAAIGLVRSYWPGKKRAGCAKGCGVCSVAKAPQAPTLVSLEGLPTHPVKRNP